MKKLLLHTCCASCLSYAYKRLSANNYLPIVYFYNPQISDKIEFLNRLKYVQEFATKNNLLMVIPEYDKIDFDSPISPWLDKKSIKYISDKNRFRRKRCEFCYQLRIEKTISEAKKRRLKYFSTTLLTSPYQDHEFIDFFASELSKKNQIDFYYDDWRKGYWQGRNFAKNQKYNTPSFCGCSFSIVEKMLE